MPHSITLQTSDGTITDNDILGQIGFAAPNETGADALLVAASIFARAETAFDADENETELVFATAAGASASPTSGLAGDMTLSSWGRLTVADDLVIKAGGTIGGANDTDLLTLGTGVLTVAGTLNVSHSDTIAYGAGSGATLHLPSTTINTAQSGSSTYATFSNAKLLPTTLTATNASVVITDAANLHITAAPIASTNITITNAWGLWVDSGNARFDGSIVLYDSDATQSITIKTPAFLQSDVISR